MLSKKFLLLLFFTTTSIFSQSIFYPVSNIPDSLKTNANAVIRLDKQDVAIMAQDKMVKKTNFVVTVFNSDGYDNFNFIEGYDPNTKIKNQRVIVYDALGKEIKKSKKEDFKDQSTAGDYTVLSDVRVSYFKYTPTTYPITIAYESEVESSSTAHLDSWYFISHYLTSVEKSIYNISFPDNLGFKKREHNFDNFKIKKLIDNNTQLSYEATNILALKEEYLSPSEKSIFPYIDITLEKFNLKGIDADIKTWKDFGDWYATKLLEGTTDLPEVTKLKIKDLVGTEKDPIKIAKIIYNYVQNKTRYVSIQLGIGGWKPMLAADVDRLGYGDCKALSNYTRALLAIVGVPAYNTVVYGGDEKKSLMPDFASLQGNHMILCLPTAKENIFLECTSQNTPFGFQGNFTDDRLVLVVKPGASELIKTKVYEDTKNLQLNKGEYTISEEGNFSGNITSISEGIQYDDKFLIEKELPTDQEAHYKERWAAVENLKIDKLAFENNKDAIQFTEKATLTAIEYAKTVNGKMMFALNAFNRNNHILPRIRNRKTPFEIQRGYLDKDEVVVNLPKGFAMEFLPESSVVTSKYGNYKLEISKIAPDKIKYIRTNQLNSGIYTNKEYDEFRAYKEQIARADNTKIILTKKP